MSILLIPGKFNPDYWRQAFLTVDPELDIEVWPDVSDKAKIDFAIVWNHPAGELKKYPNLKCISSLGAGVDHIMSDPDLPDVPIVRVVDPWLVRDMTQYICWAILQHIRKFDQYAYYQAQKTWNPLVAPDEITVGIMGAGVLGLDAGEKLQALGMNVLTWSRTTKDATGIESYAGAEGFDEFLACLDVLVCLLPLTPETKHILNRELFQKIKPGAYLINAARGQHLIEEDLLVAIDKGQLSGACLDVFDVEPLPADHPFWIHKKIIVTPHIASMSNPVSVAKQIIENYKNALAGRPLLNLVDRKLGY